MSDIRRAVATALKVRCTNDEMPVVAMAAAGLVIPEFVEGVSKFDRALSALARLTDREIGEIARRLGVYWIDVGLEESGLAILEAGQPPITEISRRDIAKVFGDDLSGDRNTLEMIQAIFQLDSPFDEFFGGGSLSRNIERHVIRNPGDWSVEYLLEKIGAYSCSRDRFVRLLEAALHPLARRGTAQEILVNEISSLLRRDGYELRIADEESGYPVYRVHPAVRGVSGSPKNLIFASLGPKPEIGFNDAINNDIVILSNAASCLVYDRAIRRDGLLWSELVEWWRSKSDDQNPARALGLRLRACLASDAERTLFDSFFQLYRRTLGERLPALIPQVYLHYDPAIARHLRRRPALARQRMDFLLLLKNRQRIVLEVDGKHHFSKDGEPSLVEYAKMVSADRDLRLSGYEVFRFGANELVGQASKASLKVFFDQLFRLHEVT